MKFSTNKKLIFSLILWLMLWAGYNTYPQKLDFSNPLNFFHGIRAFFPILAGFFALVFLIKRRSFLKNFQIPLGFFLVYVLIGVISSIFLSVKPFIALYWAISYFSVLAVLFLALADSNSTSLLFINLNWIIVSVITIGLFAFFLVQPGVISSFANGTFLSGRPYESLAGVHAEVETFGMAGTRPTGLGRYAGLVAIFALTRTILNKKRKKFLWYFLFLISFFILYFSQAKTAIFGFILGVFVIFLLKSKSKREIFSWSIFTIFLLILTFIFLFCLPYLEKKIVTSQVSLVPLPEAPLPEAPLPEVPASYIPSSALTLGGRAVGIWPQAWELFLKSPIIGWGFHADRFLLGGQHTHNAILHALVQTGILGTIPFMLAFIFAWIILFKFLKQSRKPFLIEIAGILAFFTVRGITESTGAFFGADLLIIAPLFAYLQFLESKSVRINQRPDYSFIERHSKEIPSIQVLGNKVHMVQIPEVIEQISYWIENEKEKSHWVVVTAMHGIMAAHRDLNFKKILNSSDLWVPDGISLIWIARSRGFNLKKRVSGTDLMMEFFKISNEKGYKNFFYGDTEETLKLLSKKLLVNFPNLKIAGFYSPPFRLLTLEEDAEIIRKINEAKPDILWVGLGLPKQENWIFEHKEKLNVPVIIGVGAAFKFLSGRKKRAPTLLGNLGLEWLWRFFQEPKRVWRRVFIDIPLFIFLVLLEIICSKFKR